LGDDKIAHLVAFVQAIQSEDPDVASDGANPNAPPPVQLARWVVPVAPAPPSGMIQLASRSDTGDAESVTSRSQNRRLGLVRFLSLGLTGIHGLLLIGVMIASSNVLVRDLLDDSPRLLSATSEDGNTWWSWSMLGWIVATLLWFVVFLFSYLMM